MVKKKLNIDLLKKNKVIVIAVVAVLVLLAILFLPKKDFSDSDIVSKIPGLVTDKINCIYLGDTPKYGHFGQYSGNVINEGDSNVTDVKIVVEFIDIDGKSVGTHETLIVGENIGPGMKKPFFSYTENGTLSGKFESCRATIE